MVNNKIHCGECGAENEENNKFCKICGADLHTTSAKKASKIWYLLPIFFSIFGGIIGYLAVKNKDKRTAKNILYVGLGMFVLGIIIFALIPAPEYAPRGSYQNPADISETVIVKSGGDAIEVTVLEVERGENVWDELYVANMFNDEPKEGFEYLLAKIRVAYSGKSSRYISNYDFDFKAYAEGVGCNPAAVVLPDGRPGLERVDLMPGGQTDGWICFEVPKNKESLIACEYLFEPLCFINIGS